MPVLMMHAVIKIVSFLVFGAAMTLGQGQLLLAGSLLVAGLYLFGDAHPGDVMRMLRRLRWLFISIIMVYLFFTPGQLLWSAVPWGPTVEGLLQGILRVGVLVLLVAAISWVIGSTEENELLSAVLWCLRPLSLLGLPHERLAVRISLTLESVSAVRERIQKQDARSSQASGSRLAAIARQAQDLVRHVIARAEAEPLREISLPAESRPPLLQWLIPLSLAALFVLLKWYRL